MGQYFLGFYALALIASMVTYRRFFDTPLRLFPIFIAYTFFNELLGYFIMHFEEFSFFEDEAYHWHNVIIYNIYHIIFHAYLFWVYFKLLKNRKHLTWFKRLVAMTVMAYGVSLFFQDPLHSNLYYADTLCSISMVIVIGCHFSELSKYSRAANSHNLMVYFGAGFFLFNLYFPFYILNGYLNVDFFLDYHLRQVLWGVISVMYSTFTLGFFISKRAAFR
ncbi:hypothetical protein ABV409_12515 [Flagellimonas sp. DF-77]|uniref:hypothetical protein n=1 Tax=Flagellimonas algarum TaxID=3230298 RepID=UPI003396FC8C